MGSHITIPHHDQSLGIFISKRPLGRQRSLVQVSQQEAYEQTQILGHPRPGVEGHGWVTALKGSLVVRPQTLYAGVDGVTSAIGDKPVHLLLPVLVKRINNVWVEDTAHLHWTCVHVDIQHTVQV